MADRENLKVFEYIGVERALIGGRVQSVVTDARFVSVTVTPSATGPAGTLDVRITLDLARGSG